MDDVDDWPTYLRMRLRQNCFRVVITSHETCIQEAELLSQPQFNFEYLVVDGRRSPNLRSLSDFVSLESKNRLLVTDSPTPHAMDERWSLLEFLESRVGMVRPEYRLCALLNSAQSHPSSLLHI